MKQLAAMMMFTAWLLYGAMPVVAMPVTPGTPPETMQDHDRHRGMQATKDHIEAVQVAHQHGETQSPCPHGSGKGCMAPFCAACLVLLPEIAFADPGRFVHSVPKPEDGPSLLISATRPPTPPPRA